MTETERTEEKKKGRLPGGRERGEERKKSRMPGGESHIGRSWELGRASRKIHGGAREFQGGAREQIAASRSSRFSPGGEHELITARRILECRPPPFSPRVTCFTARFEPKTTTAGKNDACHENSDIVFVYFLFRKIGVRYR